MGQGVTRVAVLEDDPDYRSSLCEFFQHAPGFELAESYCSADAALREAEDRLRRGVPAGWDLVMTDLEMPGTSGIEGTRKLKTLLPDLTVVVMTVFEDPATVVQAICAGADGYLLKKSSTRELFDALRAITAGGAPLTAAVARTVLDLVRQAAHVVPKGRGDRAPSRIDLTGREQDVLRCFVEGQAYKEVAETLGISIDTVRTHVRATYKKLQVHSMAQAVERAIRQGLI